MILFPEGVDFIVANKKKKIAFLILIAHDATIITYAVAMTAHKKSCITASPEIANIKVPAARVEARPNPPRVAR